MGYAREIEVLTRAWKAEPNRPHFAPLAELLRKDGRFEEALEVLRVGLPHFPRHVPGYVVLARCYRDLNREAEAEATYQEALAIEPGHPIVLQELAKLPQRPGQR
ncbi:MAG TPA: tetratricopeptide repeat protein [Gemmatimonadales bacterium]|nr:tetratricopeptide repeat protein [Gemmatimonadales bacterium]